MFDVTLETLKDRMLSEGSQTARFYSESSITDNSVETERR